MIRFFFLRHAPAEKTMADPPVLPFSCPSLGDLPQEYIALSSPLRRAQETFRGMGIGEYACDASFAEQDFGLWETLSWTEIAQSFPQAHADFWRDPVHAVPPEGESFASVVARVRGSLARLCSPTAKTYLIASHAGAIRAALAVALGVADRPQAVLRFEIPHLYCQRIDYISGEDWIVHSGRRLV
ncbi:MAG TPA: histidine phosphatase family protein [Dongiaceae bacterium]|jgi:broad specificity phosphatase PhoE|nr:histidine phosphatase family protein [Dongiaceae bacterium]